MNCVGSHLKIWENIRQVQKRMNKLCWSLWHNGCFTLYIFFSVLQLQGKSFTHSSSCLCKGTKEQATTQIKLPRILLKSLIYPLHCSFYKLVLVGKHEMGKKKNLFWHTKVILCTISSTALVKNVTSYLTVKSLPLLSPLELCLPAACQFNLFFSAGCYYQIFFFRTESCFNTPDNIFTHSLAMPTVFGFDNTQLPIISFALVKGSEMVLCAFCTKWLSIIF